MARLSVHLVVWNHARVLCKTLEMLRAQTFKDFTLTVVDNASTDGSVDVVREGFPEATVLRNFKNLGLSAGHNQAIALARNRWVDDDRKGRSATDRYIVVMTPDVLLTPDFFERLTQGVDGHAGVASACGKVFQAYRRIDDEGDPIFSDVLDSAGLRMRRDRRAVDRGSGERDGQAFAEAQEVFGTSGTLAMYRAEAIDALREADGEFFDETFFSYLEDVDVAWRLRLLGWTSLYVPSAVAYRYRGGGVEKSGFGAFLARQRGVSSLANRLLIRNQLLLLAKNDDITNQLLHLPWILVQAFGKFLSTLLLTPSALGAYGQAFALLPRMWKKRCALHKRRKATRKDIRAWFA